MKQKTTARAQKWPEFCAGARKNRLNFARGVRALRDIRAVETPLTAGCGKAISWRYEQEGRGLIAAAGQRSGSRSPWRDR